MPLVIISHGLFYGIGMIVVTMGMTWKLLGSMIEDEAAAEALIEDRVGVIAVKAFIVR